MEMTAALQISIPHEARPRYSNLDDQTVLRRPKRASFWQLQKLPFCSPFVRSPGEFNNELPMPCYFPFCPVTGCSPAQNCLLKSNWLILPIESLLSGFTFPLVHYPFANLVLFDKRIQTQLVLAYHRVTDYDFDKAIWVLMSVESLAAVWPESIAYPEFHNRSTKAKPA